MRFPQISKDFFFTLCGSLILFTRANANWVIHAQTNKQTTLFTLVHVCINKHWKELKMIQLLSLEAN